MTDSNNPTDTHTYSVPGISQFFFEEGIHILVAGFPAIPMSRGALVRIALSAIAGSFKGHLCTDEARWDRNSEFNFKRC